MIVFNKKFVLLSCCCVLLLQSCSKVDEYMLGKDNTPKPAALEFVTPKLDLVQNWSVSNGKGTKSNSYLKLKPVIRNNIVYTADNSGSVQAFDKKTAKVLWSKQLKQGVISGPSVADGYIALGTNSSTIVLLKQTDGSEVWQVNVLGDVLSKPVIANQKVVAKTIDGNLYAFNLLTGEKMWVYDHGAPSLILKASSSPVVAGKLVLVGFSDGKLEAVDLQSGALVWQRSIAFANGASDVERLVDIDADPIVRGNIAYLASYQGYVGALSLVNGEFLWRKPASTYKNLAIDANTLYMADSDDIVWALDRLSGQVKWKQLALKARGLTEPSLMNDRLIVGDKTGYLHVLSTHNGELISRTQLSAAINIAPAVAGNTVYVMTANGKLNSLSVS